MIFEEENADVYCRNQGFTSAPCPAGEVPVAYCSASDQYHKCDWTVYRYNSTICPPNSVPNGDTCKLYSSGCECSEKGYIWNADLNRCEFHCSSDADCSDGKVCNRSDGQCYAWFVHMPSGEVNYTWKYASSTLYRPIIKY